MRQMFMNVLNWYAHNLSFKDKSHKSEVIFCCFVLIQLCLNVYFHMSEKKTSPYFIYVCMHHIPQDDLHECKYALPSLVPNGTLSPHCVPPSPHFRDVIPLWPSGRSLLWRLWPQLKCLSRMHMGRNGGAHKHPSET